MLPKDAAWHGKPLFAGQVEPCINGRVAAIGAYFGQDAHMALRRRPVLSPEQRQHRQRPAKPQTEGREQPDYITIRSPASGAPLALQKRALYRVHGFLQGRKCQGPRHREHFWVGAVAR